jgi:protein TonB
MKILNPTVKNLCLATLGLAVLSTGLQAATNPVRLKEGMAPPYPEALEEQGVEGMAKIKVVINEEGIVTEAEVASATHEPFGINARETVRQWTFFPATEDGVPVPQTVTIPLKFNLSPKDKLNAKFGRKVFVDIDELTDKVYTWADIKKWVGLRKNHTRVIPYPEEMKGSGKSEEITARLIIAPDGWVLNPALQDVQNKEFIMPAIEHIANVRFKVPKIDGEPVYLEQKVKFICSEDPDFGKK